MAWGMGEGGGRCTLVDILAAEVRHVGGGAWFEGLLLVGRLE